jgi:hypothetical protein
LLLFGLIALLVLSPFPATTAQAAAGDLVIEQRLTDDPPSHGGNFGKAVAMDRDRLVVLAEGWEQGYELRSYRRQGVAWSLQRSIALATEFVSDIDLSGDTLAVAMPYTGSGQVRIYDLSTPQTTPVILSDPFDSPVEVPYSGFARSVAVDGGRVVVGVEGDPGKRYALFYERSGTSWSLAPGGMINAGVTAGWFARRVDISGDVAAVPDADSVYLYRWRSTGWALEDKVPSPGGNYIHDEAGALVGGDTLMLSQRTYSGSGETVFVLRRGAGNQWQIEQRIPVPGQTLGVAYAGSELAILDQTGLVQLWDRQASGWVRGPRFALPLDGTPFDIDWRYTNPAMGVSAGRIAVGVPESRPQDIYAAGRVTILRRGGPPTAPPTAPTNVAVTASKTTGTATVSWRRPVGGAVTSYLVRAEPQITSFEGGERRVPATSTSTTFTGLRELGDYRFSVQAIGPGGEGPVSRSGVVRLGGPAAVGSPYVLRDPAGDHRDPRQDIRSVTVDATGEAVTLSLRTAAPRSPYTDPMYRQAGRVRFRALWRTPVDRGAIFDHVSINDGPKLPNEDYVFRFGIPRPCSGGAVFAARYVDGAIQATVPARCLDNSRALRFRARTSDAGQDLTAWSPPITRPAAKGTVSVTNAKATSTAVWASLPSRVSVSYTAKHSSGVARATTRIFSQRSGQRPVRLQSDSCRKRSATTSTCTATFTLKPGEVRDTDSGAWRVFTEVRARNGSVAVKENVVTFGVRRATSLDRSTGTVRGGTLTVKSQLVGARWNNHDYPALGGRNLLLELKPRGSDRWQTVRTLRTDAQGRAAATVTATRKGSWRLRFGGATTYAPSTKVIATTR